MPDLTRPWWKEETPFLEENWRPSRGPGPRWRIGNGVAGVFRKIGDENGADHALNVMPYHTHAIESAQVAHEAGVDKLVLTHIIPPLPNATIKWMFTRGMKDHFDGEIMVAEDGMRFYLPPTP